MSGVWKKTLNYLGLVEDDEEFVEELPDVEPAAVRRMRPQPVREVSSLAVATSWPFFRGSFRSSRIRSGRGAARCAPWRRRYWTASRMWPSERYITRAYFHRLPCMVSGGTRAAVV